MLHWQWSSWATDDRLEVEDSARVAGSDGVVVDATQANREAVAVRTMLTSTASLLISCRGRHRGDGVIVTVTVGVELTFKLTCVRGRRSRHRQGDAGAVSRRRQRHRGGAQASLRV
jgi:hypothetical protein